MRPFHSGYTYNTELNLFSLLLISLEFILSDAKKFHYAKQINVFV